MTGFSGKYALVTGAGSGIGQAAARALGSAGAFVVVSGASQKAAETARLIRDEGGRADFVQADLTRGSDLEALFNEIRARHGMLDLAFNNAGVGGTPTPILDAPVAQYDSIFAINARAVWQCMQQELRMMQGRRGASIVNNSSVHGTVAMAGQSAYVASKHAVIGMTKAVALEMAPHGIRVNCLCPGATITPMLERWSSSVPDAGERLAAIIPLGRPADAGEAAAAALWLLSDAACYITGQSIIVDGGFSIA